MKKRLVELLKTLAVIFAVGIAYYFFCKLTHLGLKCPIYSLTGFLCAGCGLSRMCISLIELDFRSALYYNAAFMLLSPLFLSVIISYYYHYVRTGKKCFRPWHRIILIVCITVLLAFGILRNVIPLGLPPTHQLF